VTQNLYSLSRLSNVEEFSIEGVIKRRSDLVSTFLMVVYFITLLLFFPPIHPLSVFLWCYSLVLVVLIVYKPDWWLWAVVVSVSLLGFVPNLFGVFNKEFFDGSFISLSALNLGQVSGLRNRVVSLSVLGIHPSIIIWWVREKKIMFPGSFIAIASLGLLMIISSIVVCFSYMQLSVAPLRISFLTPDFLGKLPAERIWWQTGMPYTLMAFTVIMTFTNLVGGALFVCVYNLQRKNKKFFNVFLSAMAFSTVLSVMYGLAQMKGLVPAFTAGGRFESTFQSQGSYGIFVGISCVFYFNRFFLSNKRSLVSMVLFLIALLGLFVNKSRTASIALMINPFMLYLGYVIVRRYTGEAVISLWKRTVLAVITVCIIGSSLLISMPKYNSIIRSHFSNLNNPLIVRVLDSFNIDKGGIMHALSGRLDIWDRALYIWYRNPVQGCGEGQLYWQLRYLGGDDTAASQYLLVLCEMGLVGFVLLLWVIWLICRDLTAHLLTREPGINLREWLLMLMILINIYLQSFTIHVLHFVELPLLIGIITAVALASSRVRSDLLSAE